MTKDSSARLGDLSRVQEAYESAHLDIKNLKVGDEFKGAFPAALARGFEKGTVAFDVYTTIYLDNCPKIWTTRHSHIICNIDWTTKTREYIAGLR